MAQEKGPHLEFDHITYDGGFMADDEVIDHVFKFRNSGDEPLTITNAQAGCSCTVPTYSKEPIPPSATGTIQVRVTKKGDHWDGKVTVFSNDPIRPQIFLHAYGHPLKGFRVIPNELEMLIVKNADDPKLNSPVGEIKIQAVRKDSAVPDIQLKAVRILNNAIKLSFDYQTQFEPKQLASGQDIWELPIKVTADSAMSQGDYRATISVAVVQGATMPQQERYVFPNIKVRNNCEVDPFPNVYISNIQTSTAVQEVTKDVVVKSLLESPFKILSATTTDSNLKISVEGTPEAAREHIVRITLPADHPPGPLDSKLFIKTDFPKDADIVLPLMGMIRYLETPVVGTN